jgi:hypothetical protein
VTALVHDRKPALQYGPVEGFAGRCGLAMDADGVPAGRALPEHVHRVGLGFDDPGDPGADLGDPVRFGDADEHALLDAVAVGLQEGGYLCAAPVIADVVGDYIGQRHDSPVQVAEESWT